MWRPSLEPHDTGSSIRLTIPSHHPHPTLSINPAVSNCESKSAGHYATVIPLNVCCTSQKMQKRKMEMFQQEIRLPVFLLSAKSIELFASHSSFWQQHLLTSWNGTAIRTRKAFNHCSLKLWSFSLCSLRAANYKRNLIMSESRQSSEHRKCKQYTLNQHHCSDLYSKQCAKGAVFSQHTPDLF